MRPSKEDIRKANRKGSRDAELENQNGWDAKEKIHKSKKAYKRKSKYKDNFLDLL